MSEIAGINLPNVSRFFAERVPGGDVPLEFSLISGGRSNLTYLVRGGGQEWVLRRPPLGHVLPTAHDMAREYRVLAALADTDVPVARPLALCEDAAVNDMPFYVMEYRPGVVLATAPPQGYADTPAQRRAVSLALVDTMVRLHAVDYRAVGLEGFGHPEGYVERQVRRWAQQWERSKTGPLPEIDVLAERLRRALPSSPPPTIVHGDFRLGNLALDPHDPGRVIAVFDWEMATLGDPLADLGYTLIYWADPGDELDAASIGSVSSFTMQDGYLRRAELVAEYARRSGRDPASIDFYQVLALYKLAIISEGIFARYLQGKTLGEGFAGMQRPSGALAMRALAIADASADPKLR
ncbi:MAG: phosphotransferase family protein [Deltaproteobacteria bacterium]|nr:phosphotransferase family protein [Deltaproteobacteria bacterium]